MGMGRGTNSSFRGRRAKRRWICIFLFSCIPFLHAYSGFDFEIDGGLSNGQFMVTFDSQTSSYYQVWLGENLLSNDFNLTAIELGTGGEQNWIDPEPAGFPTDEKFYYAQEIHAALALDEDEDGMDSYFEFQFPFLNPL